MDLKEIIGIIAVILTFVGYTPYILDTIKGKTRPHIFTWLLWTLVTGGIFALQFSGGAGAGSWVTLCLTVILFTVFLLGLKQGEKDIRKIDILFFIIALLALILWLVVDQPTLSAIILSGIDMLAFIPTIRKSWNAPHSETLSLYVITTFRHGLSILAITNYSIVTWLFPVTWVVANALFSVMLIARRKKLG